MWYPWGWEAAGMWSAAVMKWDVGIILRPPTTTVSAARVRDKVENGQSQNKFTVQGLE